ncbi:MAG: glycosyltransferase [Candidatus Eremiobacteraeota bacterium]|nr:glycosyltransferase [Candidatus Eremiobacteraeota bacterium]
MNEPGALDLSIVIPAFKEGAKIERDVLEAAAFLERQQISGEIIVVDDGSPDDTAERAARLRETVPSLRVLTYKRNRGKGHAVRMGVAHAAGRIVMFADAGLCVPFDIARIGISMLEMDMCDIAHGSRRMRGSVVVRQSAYRRIGSKLYKFFIHTFMGIPLYISDTQCGFKLYRREVAQRLFGAAFTDGFMFDIEVILRALHAKDRILEFPVLWSNDPDTRYDPVKGTIRNLVELVKVRLAMARPAGEHEAPETCEERSAGVRAAAA